MFEVPLILAGIGDFLSGAVTDFFLALKTYLYGLGWLVICIAASIVGFRLFDRFCPIDFRAEIEKGNMAFAIMAGLFLLGLTFGILYLAAHVS